jgi:hypothetical protein
MNIFPRLSALFLLSAASVTLFACSAPTSAPDDVDAETTAAAAEPLVGSYEGTDITRTEHSLRIRDERAVSPVVTGEGFRGMWATDPNAFVLCNDQHCLQSQKSLGSGER